MGDQHCDKGHGRGGPGLIENAILLAGPTASGKSGLALALAEAVGGTILNADSMQVYDGLRILSARPEPDATARAPHRLYGHVPPERSYSVGAWLADVEALRREGALGQRPIFVGGTGLYFTALTRGLATLPPIPDPVRDRWRQRLADEGAQALHDELDRRDRAGAALLQPTDGLRLVRALEVLEATGKPLRFWQETASPPLVTLATATCLLLEPPRTELNSRIDRRFDAMMAEGALAEAALLRARVADDHAPALKAIGVRELAAAAGGEIPIEQAIAQSKVATRRYAKRQSTFFRTQFGTEWQRFAQAPDPSSFSTA